MTDIKKILPEYKHSPRVDLINNVYVLRGWNSNEIIKLQGNLKDEIAVEFERSSYIFFPEFDHLENKDKWVYTYSVFCELRSELKSLKTSSVSFALMMDLQFFENNESETKVYYQSIRPGTTSIFNPLNVFFDYTEKYIDLAYPKIIEII